ncbi:CsbD family protein [Shewanella oncorhynchi]|uniref:CsbD family protein n=1 Tax=Shewanella oncorhynchi TaxID=2726434 RepID=UPI003D7A1F3D
MTINKDQIEGSIKDAAGKVQQKIGEIVGNPKQQMKGVQKQIKGKTQKAIGNVKEAAKDAEKHS